MQLLKYCLVSLLFLSSCDKFDWNNPYDPECPKELFTPSSPGATMEGNSVKLTWSQQNDDISGFALFRSAEGESITNLTQTQKSTTQYIDANITPGKKYTYYVVAVAGTNKSDTVKAEIIPVIPITISTGAVTELAATSAKVTGNITNAGGGTVTSRGICWSTTPNPTVNSSKTTEGTGAGEFTSTLTNLLAGTTYYARAYGENSRGISYGSEVTFITLGPPKLTTTAVSNITATSATSGGTIISDGGSPITAKGVVWSTSPSPTIDLSTKTNDGTGVVAFTSTMSNLTNNTKYYFRTYATNIVGTTYGDEFSFTTSTPIPELLKQGLVAYYPFNGNANDESGNGNHGILRGVVSATDRLNSLNSAYSFDGRSFIEIPTSSAISSLTSQATFSMFVFSNNGDAYLLCKSNSSVGDYRIFSTSTYLRIVINSKEYSINYNFPTNRWYHFTCTIINNNINIYIDGNLVASTNIVYANYPLRDPTTSLEIGRDPWGLSEFHFGKLDEIYIHNRVLTPSEIIYLANN